LLVNRTKQAFLPAFCCRLLGVCGIVAAGGRIMSFSVAVRPGRMRRPQFALGLLLLTALFLGVALWNGFPLVFYDTGGYLAEGLQGAFLAERSPAYSLLLFLTGGAFSLWPVVILQALLTAWLIAETARAEQPDLSLKALLLVGAVLMLATAIGWYVGQVEPDGMTALVVLGA